MLLSISTLLFLICSLAPRSIHAAALQTLSCLDPDRSRVDRSHIDVKIRWDSPLSQQLIASIAGIVLHDLLGFSVEYVEINTSLHWGPAMSAGVYDIDVEQRQLEPLGKMYSHYISDTAQVVDAGRLGYAGRAGLYTFNTVLESARFADFFKFYQNASRSSQAGLRLFSESTLASFLDASSSSIAAASPCGPSYHSWCQVAAAQGYWAPPRCVDEPGSCLEIMKTGLSFEAGYLEQLVQNNHLEAVVAYYGDDTGAVAEHLQLLEASALTSSTRTPLFFWWEPSALLLRVNATRVSFPDFTHGCDAQNTQNPDTGHIVCDFHERVIHKLVSRSLREKAPEAFYFLSRMEFSTAEIHSLLLSTQEGGGIYATAGEAACNFVQESPKVLHWVPKCLTRPEHVYDDGHVEWFNPQTEQCENRTGFPWPSTYCFNGGRRGTADRSGTTIRIVRRDWVAHSLLSTIAEALLRDYLGYNVVLLLNNVTSTLDWGPELSAEMYDFDAESWQVIWGSESYVKYIDSGRVHHFGLVGYAGRAGIFLPTAAMKRDPLSDYYKFYRNATLAAAEGWVTHNKSYVSQVVGSAYPLQQCGSAPWCDSSSDTPGRWVSPHCRDDPGRCIEILHWSAGYDASYFEQLSNNLGLEVVIAYVGTFLYPLVDMYLQEGLVVPFYWWSPDAGNYLINSTRVSFPDYSFGCNRNNTHDPATGSIECDIREVQLVKLGSVYLRGIKEAAYVLHRLQLRRDDLDELFPQHLDAGGTKTSEELGCQFLHRNEARIREWVPTCLSDPPGEGLARVNDTIFSMQDNRCITLTCPHDQILEYLPQSRTYNCRPCPHAGQVPDAMQENCLFCNAGEEVEASTGASCRSCKPGFYSLSGSSECSPCPVGQAASSPGQSSCMNCPIGQHQNLTGQSHCFECPVGRSAPQEQLTDCVLCVPGRFASQKGLEACDACQPGQHQDAIGASECRSCNPGMYSLEQAEVMCLECYPGFFQPNRSSPARCERCPVGKYIETPGSSFCEPCALGTTAQPGAASAADCSCAEGTFLMTRANGVMDCVTCLEHMESCPGGNALPYQRKGYFVTSDAQEVYRCVSEEACPGGLIGSCPAGSKGLGCADCKKGEYHWNGSKCKECRPIDSILAAGFIVFLVVMLLAIYRLGNDPIGHDVSSVSEFLVATGLALNIFLYLSSLDSIDVKWQEPVKSLMLLSTAITVEFMRFNASCSMVVGHIGSYTFTSALPLVIIVVCAGVGVVTKNFISHQKLFNTVATCTYAGYLLLVLHALKPFRYIVHPDGDKSLLDMPDVFKDTHEHTGLMIIGISVMLVYCVPFLALCIWAAVEIRVTRASPKRRWLLATFRFLFYKFCPDAYYWGICILLRNAIFALAPSVAPEIPQIGLFMLSAAAAASAVQTAFISPWRCMWMNVVDVGILCYMLLVLNLASGWVEQKDDADDILGTFLIVSIGVLGVLGVFVLVYLLLGIVCASKSKRVSLRRLSIRADAFHLEDMMTLTGTEASEAFEVFDELDHLVQNQASAPMKRSAVHHQRFQWVAQENTDQRLLVAIAQAMRVREYSLEEFYSDCLLAFPELQLYSSMSMRATRLSSRNLSKKSTQGSATRSASTSVRSMGTAPSSSTLISKEKCVGGYTCTEEQQRTIGALFALYCMCRLDMDGKEILAFGVDETNGCKALRPEEGLDQEKLKKEPWGKMSPLERRAFFYWHFNWELLESLALKSGILRHHGGKLVADAEAGGRLVALLSLTAYHDIMKDRALCPTVFDEPYEGILVGEVIEDHDLALAYILDRHPELLPSFRILTPDQRRLVRFTQSEMGFNAGWLVQAEGPPAAVLGKLKHAILHGGALSRDVAFYFAHWVTDLAGAEPTPFQGSEKFAVKFPPHILQGLLSCFSVVESLASQTETEVYEAYMRKRWQDETHERGDLPSGPERVAKMRLHCMAQQHAGAILAAFDKLAEDDQQTLIHELAVTGMPGQEFKDWSQSLRQSAETKTCSYQAGTPFLLYYGPAWCQRIGASNPDMGLRIMADIFRLGRAAYPESMDVHREQQAGIRYRTLEVGILKTVPLDDLETMYETIGPNCFRVRATNRLEASLTLDFVIA